MFQGIYPDGTGRQTTFNCPIQINMVYPSKEFFKTNTEFASRHKSMQAEADEHYQYLLDMQKTDSDFDRMLFENH